MGGKKCEVVIKIIRHRRVLNSVRGWDFEGASDKTKSGTFTGGGNAFGDTSRGNYSVSPSNISSLPRARFSPIHPLSIQRRPSSPPPISSSNLSVRENLAPQARFHREFVCDDDDDDDGR